MKFCETTAIFFLYLTKNTSLQYHEIQKMVEFLYIIFLNPFLGDNL